MSILVKNKICLLNQLEELYLRFNRREYVNPDPLQFLFDYDNIADREIVGLVASSLAYGNVKQILASVEKILKPMEGKPCSFVENNSGKEFKKIYKNFKHRWHTGEDVAGLLVAIGKVIELHGGLEGLFTSVAERSRSERPFDSAQGPFPLVSDQSYLPALTHFVQTLRKFAPNMRQNLLPCPSDGSACKRLWMYLRWMIRKDAVDPGGWNLSPAHLIVPMDTHMFALGRKLKLTRRKQANLQTALEMTEHFKKLCPEDPVKYDFALTRLGIRAELGYSLLEKINK